jgi:hypothetical protein
MKVEVLYFEGCPNHVPAIEMVRRVLTREGIEAQVVPVDVHDVETAMTLRFLGSPSIRVNGRDNEPGREDDPPFLRLQDLQRAGKDGRGAPGRMAGGCAPVREPSMSQSGRLLIGIES